MVEVEIGEELLKLLRQLNEKMESPKDDDEDDADFAARSFAYPPLFNWFDVTKPKPPRIKVYGEGSAGPDIQPGLEPETRESNRFKYQYKPTFQDRTGRHVHEISCVDEMIKHTGCLWTIPEDGRIQFTISYLNFWKNTISSSTNQDLETITKIGNFNSRLSHDRNGSFHVKDVNPWYQSGLAQSVEYWPNLDRPILGEVKGFQVRPGSLKVRNFEWENRKLGLEVFHESAEDGTPMTSSSSMFVDPLCCEDPSASEQGDSFLDDAPWRRLITIVGLGSVPAENSNRPNYSWCPYIDLDSPYVEKSIQSHLLCTRTEGNLTTNPYTYEQAFQLNFFAAIHDKDALPSTTINTPWKFGKLFGNGAEEYDPTRYLARRSITVYVQTMPNQVSIWTVKNLLSPFYTILHLLPPTELSDYIVIGEVKIPFTNAIADPLACRTALEAELSCIVAGLLEIIRKWSDLNEYFSDLLVEDFMDPKEYARLLFDDGKFTRSRKYFWAIGCLSEFDICISDNIKQWDLYYHARCQPILKSKWLGKYLLASCMSGDPLLSEDPSSKEQRERKDRLEKEEKEKEIFQLPEEKRLPMLNKLAESRRMAESTRLVELKKLAEIKRIAELKSLIRLAQGYRGSLVDLKTQFELKLEKVKSLRDGLFNASALVESREATRLGENVKLLTYVSIFYLPLAFCSSLWAIPNILERPTKVAFIVTAVLVGVITYIIAFNMDHLTSNFSGSYKLQRKKLVAEMEEEEGSWWSGLGKQFEEFKPDNEKKIPSEWWIPVYVGRKIFTKSFWSNSKTPLAKTEETIVDKESKGNTNHRATGLRARFSAVFGKFGNEKKKSEAASV